MVHFSTVVHVCPEIALENGMVQIKLGQFGDIARVKCNHGYNLQGSALQHCSDGNWIGIKPSCKCMEQTKNIFVFVF